MKKRTPKEIHKQTYLIFIVGIILAGAGLALNEQIVLIMLGLLVIFSSIVHHVLFYRCPHCGKFLDRSTGEFCSGCGKKVNEPE